MLDLSFASKNWLKTEYAQDEPGMLVRWYFEVMVLVEELRYRHIDALFSADPQTAVNWKLIEKNWPTLMRVALSVKEGTVSSVTLLRRLNNRSHKNEIYKVFREVGRAVRTVVLLRYLSEPSLREQITRATNKAEAYNGFAKWLAFGSHGLLTSRDPE